MLSPMLSCLETLNLLRVLEVRMYSDGEVCALQEHLDSCDSCRAALGSRELRSKLCSPLGFSKESAGRSRIARDAYSAVIDQVYRGVLEENSRMEDQRATAPALLAELLSFSSGQQRLLVRNSSRYHLWALAEEALAESRRGWAEDPGRSEELALLAVEITNQLDVSGFQGQLLNDLRAEAWSYVANCRRIRTDYDDAQRAFRKAEVFLEKGSGDRLERARLLDLKASLLVDLRELQPAESLLTEAIEEYRAARECHLEGRALMKAAKLLRLRGEVGGAIPVLQRAAALIDVGTEPRLAFALRNNLVAYLSESGRPHEAQKLLPQVRDLVKRYGSHLDRLRLMWTEGFLRKALGQTELAIEIFAKVREGFAAAGIGYDAASVSLDLAELYLESGRTGEARELASESIPLFTSRGVHREALAAWTLFREAAERDALTLGLVQEVAARIRQTQSGPAAGGDLP